MTKEYIIAARTGQDYIESLRDGRKVWIAGDNADDVASHPAFQGAVTSVASIYDMQHEDEHCDLLTVEDPERGGSIARGFSLPRSSEDLVQRRRLVETVSRTTGGTMGRLPDYGAAFAIGLLNLQEEVAKADPAFSGRIERWFDRCAREDLSLATSFVDPQVDRSLPPEENGLLHVVDDREDGIVIRGCKSVSTFGPLCNEFLVITPPRRFSSEKEVLYLSVPANTEGLRFYCREPHGTGQSQFDRPLGSRFDEPDSWALFDDVFVPRERVFLSGGDLSRVAGYFTSVLAWPWYHNLIRLSVKAELLAGICCLLTEYLDTWQFPQVQAAVSGTIEYAETLRSFLRAAEEDCEITDSGIAEPNSTTISVAKLYAIRSYPQILEVVRELAGQGIIMAPTESDLANAEIGPRVEPYYSARGVDPRDRIRLFRLAWDLACDSFGGRQMLFELFNAGGLTVSRLGVANGADKSRYIELAKQVAGIDAKVTRQTAKA